jgi:hypothetical protein
MLQASGTSQHTLLQLFTISTSHSVQSFCATSPLQLLADKPNGTPGQAGTSTHTALQPSQHIHSLTWDHRRQGECLRPTCSASLSRSGLGAALTLGLPGLKLGTRSAVLRLKESMAWSNSPSSSLSVPAAASLWPRVPSAAVLGCASSLEVPNRAVDTAERISQRQGRSKGLSASNASRTCPF